MVTVVAGSIRHRRCIEERRLVRDKKDGKPEPVSDQAQEFGQLRHR
jgi:hypothetical protein